ncbi:hypothetical protein BASA83_006712 [Batrachochytrium salamandrivorans]|nr:hypothetical protein BASA83_006712 [Batrachochytrium salamandrivorans]
MAENATTSMQRQWEEVTEASSSVANEKEEPGDPPPLTHSPPLATQSSSPCSGACWSLRRLPLEAFKDMPHTPRLCRRTRDPQSPRIFKVL